MADAIPTLGALEIRCNGLSRYDTVDDLADIFMGLIAHVRELEKHSHPPLPVDVVPRATLEGVRSERDKLSDTLDEERVRRHKTEVALGEARATIAGFHTAPPTRLMVVDTPRPPEPVDVKELVYSDPKDIGWQFVVCGHVAATFKTEKEVADAVYAARAGLGEWLGARPEVAEWTATARRNFNDAQMWYGEMRDAESLCNAALAAGLAECERLRREVAMLRANIDANARAARIHREREVAEAVAEEREACIQDILEERGRIAAQIEKRIRSRASASPAGDAPCARCGGKGRTPCDCQGEVQMHRCPDCGGRPAKPSALGDGSPVPTPGAPSPLADRGTSAASPPASVADVLHMVANAVRRAGRSIVIDDLEVGGDSACFDVGADEREAEEAVAHVRTIVSRLLTAARAEARRAALLETVQWTRWRVRRRGTRLTRHVRAITWATVAVVVACQLVFSQMMSRWIGAALR